MRGGAGLPLRFAVCVAGPGAVAPPRSTNNPSPFWGTAGHISLAQSQQFGQLEFTVGLMLPVAALHTAIQGGDSSPMLQLARLAEVTKALHDKTVIALQARIEEIEADRPRTERLYHFKESMRRFTRRCLVHVNDSLEETYPDGNYEQQRRVFIETDDSPSWVLFAGFSEENDFNIEVGRTKDGARIQTSLDDVIDHPDTYDQFIWFCFNDLDNFTFECDTGQDGTVTVRFDD